MTEVRQALSKVGLPAQKYVGHSFQVGVATTTAMLGVEDSTIQTLGRWKSNAFLLYIRLGTGAASIPLHDLSKGQCITDSNGSGEEPELKKLKH